MNIPMAKLSLPSMSTGLPALCFCLVLFLQSGFLPDTALAQFSNLEADSRSIPWSSITRLALEGGFFPPAYRPVTEGEISHLLARTDEQALAGNARALSDDSEYARLIFLLERYRHGGGGIVIKGCECKEHPPLLRFSGRMVGGYSELGNPIPFEGGLDFAAGYNTFFEPSVEFAAGSFWSALDFRIGGRAAQGGVVFDWPAGGSDPLTYPDWSIPTGKYDVRNARLKGGAWNGRVTRALVGMQCGNWALSAGWDHRRTGPGLTGNLNLDFQGRPFPAVTARRTSSFLWSGFMTHLAPDQMLLRTGQLSERTVAWGDIYGRYAKEAKPYFFQWLIGWNITSWFRTNFTHSVMATAREGTLWPDLLQINFPLIGTTWREMDSGPITDRIFAVQFEFRWRNAPWPLLPSSAGRLFWDYGGTDFLPSGPGGMIPQISIPASVAGFELLSPRWDLGFEYTELQHSKVLWYSNGGYEEGYSNEQWLMGHPLGGSGESLMGLVRVRPANWDLQFELQGKMASWGMPGFTPGTGDQHSLGLTLSRTPAVAFQSGDTPSSPLLWEITAEWKREKADPWGNLNQPPEDSEVQRDWWQIIFKIGI
jgi:hypothetical protein